ncbi:uncharacterized protein LOC111712710 isoform X1 [Eurytemora carolleeae]|uniref:uncharacterized protein LOC111712710 isoform X1 n=1 Tax=Eurytemora carolleeae TaxID=1294199 RepID=UPI000C77A050|nr:uncharacterized protein LOC111712710 isoform X1 [Eurytemora carolleeae]|eukprot:XP_023343172.1 uncharacterized protein LOC111712710 isoform X1 [Eurytemora affinis]
MLRTALLGGFLLFALVEAQRTRNSGNRTPRQNGQFGSNGVTRNGARDAVGTEVYPGCDGKVCLPEADLCANRKNKVGEKEYDGKSYWFSWDSDEAVLRNARWNWFTARNYCRKRCMDLISIESQDEQDFLGREMKKAGVRETWSSGRLCDKEVDGCDQPRFQPYNIRGWFWASTLQGMGETNVFDGRKYNAWSFTGPLNKSQPDGLLKADGFGEQACMGLLDDFFGDGLAWHDTKCNDRRLIICEDLPKGNINFVRQQNPGVVIP